MERIVREVRQSGIDYEQYFNQNINVAMTPTDSYVDNYCDYSSFFYDDSNESRGVRNSAREATILASLTDASAVTPIEEELYLINMSGNKRTMFTRVEKDLYGDGKTIGKVATLKMDGKDLGDDHIDGRDSYNGLKSHHAQCEPDDGEGDGLIDSWHCDPDFPCLNDIEIYNTLQGLCEGYAHLPVNDVNDADHSFVDISPNALNVVGLRFFVSPRDDPWKAYNVDEVQIQPHVTIQLTVAANPRLVPLTNEDSIPTITLTSTITTRNYDEIKSDCQ